MNIDNHMNWTKWLKNIFVVLLALNLIFLFVQSLTYIIPTEWMLDNIQESVHLVRGEGPKPVVIDRIIGTRLDNSTDHWMFTRSTNFQDLNLIEAALSNNNYSRYWFGTIPILRVLHLFGNYAHIRFLNLFGIFGTFVGVILMIYNRFGKKTVFNFTLVLLSIHFWIFPLSLQYSSVYYITILSIMALLYGEKILKKFSNYTIFLVGVGALTNYFDLLTAPFMTFGINFIFWMALKESRQRSSNSFSSFGENLYQLILSGLSWLIGYGGTWLIKWILGAIFLEGNLILDAANQIFFRTGSADNFELTSIFQNILGIAYPNYLLVILALVGLGYFFLIFNHRTPNLAGKAWTYLPLLLVGLLPFLVVLVMSNHTFYHAYFTYRNFSILTLSVLTYLNILGQNESYNGKGHH